MTEKIAIVENGKMHEKRLHESIAIEDLTDLIAVNTELHVRAEAARVANIAHAEATGAMNFVSAKLRKKYGISERDRIEDDGMITRGA